MNRNDDLPRRTTIKSCINHASVLILLLFFISHSKVFAQTLSFGVDGTISTVAGNHNLGAGYAGDGGPATSAKLSNPVGVVLDNAGNLYIADYDNNVVRKVSKSGTITTFAGNGTQGFSGDAGTAISAELYNPSGLAVDGSGNLYIADNGNSVIRKVDSTGTITTVAGNHSLGAGFGGDGGSATSAQLNKPLGISLDSAGNLYVSDTANNVVRKVDSSGTISTVAGRFASGGGYSGDGGPAIASQLNNPFAVAFDSVGNIYIADGNNNVVRKVLANGVITTFAGTGTGSYNGDGGAATSAGLYGSYGLAIDNTGNVYIADYGNYVVRRVDSAGVITTVAGSHLGQVWDSSYGASEPGYWGDGGPATSAGLGLPFGLALDAAGNLYIADSTNNVVRQVTAPGQDVGIFSDTAVGNQSSLTITLSNADPSISLQVSSIGLTSNTGEFAISTPSSGGCSLTSAFQLASGQSCRIAATFQPAQVGLRSTLMKVNSNGNKNYKEPGYLALEGVGLGSLSRIDGGPITSFAGEVGKAGFSGDGGSATSALLTNPRYVATDSHGNLFIVAGEVIRKVDSSGTITTVAGGINTIASGASGTAGNGGPATLANIGAAEGVAVDAAGNLYITDPFYEYVRKVDANGNISILAGTGYTSGGHGGHAGDGGPAALAELDAPFGITVDLKGNVYFSEVDNHDIRRVDTNGIITTVAGNNSSGYRGDGGLATSAELKGPWDVKVDPAGNLYIADTYNFVIRKVDTNGIITTIAGNNDYGSPYAMGDSGDGGPATSAALFFPTGIALDAANELFIADTINVIRKVDTAGIISTLGGGKPEICSNAIDAVGDGCPFTSASLNNPFSLALDAKGNLYIADGSDDVVRRVDENTDTSFGAQPEGTRATQDVFLLNIGNLPLQLASAAPFQISGTNASDFQAAAGANQGCTPGQSVQPGAYCTVTVSFMPSSLGQEAATLLINSNAANAAQTIATLSGTGTAPIPVASLSPTSLNFTATASTASLPQAATLTNTGSAPLAISSITIAGTNASNFSQTNNCGSSIAANTSCSINITFTPASATSFVATLTVTDNAAVSPQTVTLSGTGTQPPDFSLPTTTPTISVTAGQSGTAAIAVTPVAGFSGTVSFTCSVPANMTEASCSATAVQLAGTSAANSTLTVSTAAPHQMAMVNHRLTLAASFVTLFGGVIWGGLPLMRRRRKALLSLMLGLLLVFGAISCGGGGSGGNVKTDPGTPAGNYTLTVQATNGHLTHTMNVIVTVQ